MTNTQLMDYVARLEALLSDTMARVLVLEKQVFPDMQHTAMAQDGGSNTVVPH